MPLGRVYDAAFNRMLADSACVAGRRRLVVLWPMRGMRFRRGAERLMVVGRAVNGWDDTAWRASDARTWSRRQRIVSIARSESAADPIGACPLSWVTRQWQLSRVYNTANSAFWRTAKAVSDPTGRFPESWASRLCWSNLYKVAPFNGGNPSAKLKQAQLARCVELLRLEVDTFRPRRMLVMTGLDWFKQFADALQLKVERRRGYVEGVARGLGARWVITPHPERKPEARIAAAARRALESGRD